MECCFIKGKFITKSKTDTFNIAYELGKTLGAGDVISLTGDLGAGKTAFTKGLAKSIGINEHIVSPTFTIVNEYHGEDLKLYHFDVYRIDDIDELYEIGFSEYLFGEGICVIEWADKILDALPDSIIRVSINKLENENDREIIIN